MGAVGGNVDDGVVEEVDAGQGGGDVGAGADGEQREVGLDAGGAQHGDEQGGLVFAVAVVALDHFGGAHGGETGGAEFYAGVADLVVKLADDGADAGEAVGGEGRGEDGLGFGGDGLGVGHGREGFGDGGPGGAGGEFDGGDGLLVGGEVDVVAVGGVDVGLLVDDAAHAVGFLARDVEVGEVVDEVFEGERGGRLDDHADARRGHVGAEAEAVESAGGEVGSFFFGDLLLFDDGADGHAGEGRAADVGGGEGDVVFGFDGRVGDGFLVELDEGAVGLEDARVDLRGLFVPGIPLGGDFGPAADGGVGVDAVDQAVGVGEGAVGGDLVLGFFVEDLGGELLVYGDGGGEGLEVGGGEGEGGGGEVGGLGEGVGCDGEEGEEECGDERRVI